MERNRVCLLVILVVSAVSVRSYDEVKIRTLLRALPEEERSPFLRYALNFGYQLVEGSKSGNSDIYTRISPQVYRGIYQYLTDNFLITDKNALSSLRDVVCFPTGCIEIDDPGIHP